MFCGAGRIVFSSTIEFVEERIEWSYDHVVHKRLRDNSSVNGERAVLYYDENTDRPPEV